MTPTPSDDPPRDIWAWLESLDFGPLPPALDCSAAQDRDEP